MIKVTVKGEVFSFDNENYPLPEAIELEEKLGMPFAEWERGLYRGSAKAMTGLAWLAMKRDGRDVKLEDILSGAWPEGGLGVGDLRADPEGGVGPDPTPPSSPGAPSTSELSPNASASSPGSGSTSP
jgi:hypothetical protein